MIRLTVNQVLMLHQNLISDTGGIDGVRDVGLLGSALQLPFQTFDGQALYPSIQQKAARLCCSLVNNHPFVDGNKRIGIHAMLVFLAVNGVELLYSQEELISLGLSLAAGVLSCDNVLQWILTQQQE